MWAYLLKKPFPEGNGFKKVGDFIGYRLPSLELSRSGSKGVISG
jgi:hypothetical protein